MFPGQGLTESNDQRLRNLQYSINGGATYVAGPNSGYTFMGLAASMYQLRLKDANGCQSAVITKEVKAAFGGPTFLNNGSIVLDASCRGGGGAISIIPTSGTAPFQYSINGGESYVAGPASGYGFQNLSAGTYQLRLESGNGCESGIVTKDVKGNAFWAVRGDDNQSKAPFCRR